ncbi:MAG TPA: DUF47 family protein [Chthoniobacterales bacterium]|nr:DUF47 family protein [Chthoniobacterales bacterium]
MFSIRSFFGHDEKFFDLLEASAQQADTSVHELVALLGRVEHEDSAQSLEAFVHSRRKDKEITQQLTEQLVKTFITPLEREDIQALAAALYKIPKTVEKIGERILICPRDLRRHNFAKQVQLLDQAAEVVVSMVKDLRKGTNLAATREKNNRLQALEGEADAFEVELLTDLYHGNYDARELMFLRDLSDLLEKVIDRCRDAGNVILEIALKYS